MRGPSQCNKTNKQINKSVHIRKEKVKLSLFTDNIIVYVHILRNPHKKNLLQVISEFSKVSGNSINTQNQLYFFILAINN